MDIAFTHQHLSTTPLPSGFTILHQKHPTIENPFSAESFQILLFDDFLNERNSLLESLGIVESLLSFYTKIALT